MGAVAAKKATKASASKPAVKRAISKRAAAPKGGSKVQGRRRATPPQSSDLPPTSESTEPAAGLAAVAAAGNRLATLRALRDRLSRELDSCDSKRDVAALSQRLMDVLDQIAAAEKAEPKPKGTPLDELAQRRNRTASGPARAAGRK